MRFYIMKSEPSEFSISDLAQKGESLWDGIRNYQVRNLIRDVMRSGDRALFYHSSCAEVGIVGEMEIVGEAVPDPAQFDLQSNYYDSASKAAAPRWLAPKVRYVQTFTRMVTLAELRADESLQGLRLLQRGNRLSITECQKGEYEHIIALGSQ